MPRSLAFNGISSLIFRYMQLFECRNRWRRRRLAHNQLRFYGNNLWKLGAADALEQSLRREFAHAAQRLANGCEARILICRVLDIVKADYRNLTRYLDPRIEQGANCADGRDVVEREHRRKVS